MYKHLNTQTFREAGIHLSTFNRALCIFFAVVELFALLSIAKDRRE
jgi:hypothetical protein